jgi:hypothetical protein
MRRQLALVLTFATAAFVLLPGSAGSAPGSQAYELHLEVPNVSMAPNGDTIEITGMGEFSIHPKSVEAEGGFTHKAPDGTVIGSGTWEATQLLAFQPYGCGVVPSIGATLPPNFCGGALKLRVLLTTPVGALPGILTVFCIVGPNPPNSHDEPSEEGINLVVPGVANFNKIVGGMNIYIRTA